MHGGDKGIEKLGETRCEFWGINIIFIYTGQVTSKCKSVTSKRRKGIKECALYSLTCPTLP